MDIKITVDIPALDRLVDVLNAQISGAPAVTAGEVAAFSAKVENANAARAEKPKADKPKAEVAETEEPANEAATVEYPAVKKLILDLVAKKGREAATTLLGEYGAKGGGDLKAEDYASFAAKAEALVNG